MTLQKIKNFRYWGTLISAVFLGVFAILASNTGALYANSGWEANYWNNPIFSGEPVLQRYEAEINHDWAGLSPDPLVNVDNFSARWRTVMNTSTGVYQFRATTDDGMKVFVDGHLIIDSWYDSKAHTVTADVPLQNGAHKVVVEYYERGGKASAQVSWAKISEASGGMPGMPTGKGMMPSKPEGGTNMPSKPEGGGNMPSKPEGGATGRAHVMGWRGQYYANMQLAGHPTLIRGDAEINFNWDNGKPAPEMPSDHFSVRWTRLLKLNPGRYRFTTETDDGVRLWVNEQMIINQWNDQVATVHYAEIDVPGGPTPVMVEYYDNVGLASAKVSWEQVGNAGQQMDNTNHPPAHPNPSKPPASPMPSNPPKPSASPMPAKPPMPPMPPMPKNWTGTYFNNMDLSGDPALVRNDQHINFNWGVNSPDASINVDQFSVRWTQDMAFKPGHYRFTVASDDGVRLWVNNKMLVDAWNDHALQTFTGDIELSGGPVPLKLEYYENKQLAEIYLTWQLLGNSDGSKGHEDTKGPEGSKGNEGDKAEGEGGTGGQYPTATVTAESLNVRSGPGADFESLTSATKGTEMRLAGFRNADASWVQVILADSTKGWVNSSYVQSPYPLKKLMVYPGLGGGDGEKPSEKPEKPEPPHPASATVKASYLNVRQGSGITYDVLTTVTKGQTLMLLGRNADSSWVNVKLANGQVGWVSSKYIASPPLQGLPITG